MTDSFRTARIGQTLVEYALAVLLIGVVALGALTALGVDVTGMFTGVSSSIGATGRSSGSGGDSDACASGFEPNSIVTVSYGPTSGDPGLPSGSYELTADENGEIETCDPLVVPIAVNPEPYEQHFDGLGPGGVPVSQTVSTTISSPAVPNSPVNMFGAITFDTPATTLGTMTVRVRPCSSVYHRAEATMNSYGYLMAPGTEFQVYATDGWWDSSFGTTIYGGGWPEYTCDGGASNTWYRLTDGSGYVFTGGVDIVAGSYVPGTSTYPAGQGWPGTWAANGEDGSGAMANSGTTYGPKYTAVAGNSYRIRATIKGANGAHFGICFYNASNVLIGSCSQNWVENNPHWTRVSTPTVTAPSGTAFYAAQFVGSIRYDNVLSYENGTPGPSAEPEWTSQLPLSAVPSTTQTFDSGSSFGLPGTWTAGIGEDGSGAMRNGGDNYSPFYFVEPNTSYAVRMWVNGGNGDEFQICLYNADYVLLESNSGGSCDGSFTWTEMDYGWAAWQTAAENSGSGGAFLRIHFIGGFDYDNLQIVVNGAIASEPAFTEAVNPDTDPTIDFNSGANGWPSTWTSTGGPDGSGAVSSSGTRYSPLYTAVGGHTYQGFADIDGSNNAQFGICLYNSSHQLINRDSSGAFCGNVNWAENTTYAAKSTPVVSSGAAAFWRVVFIGTMTYDNFHMSDNGS